ncbi:MAG: ATP-binding cassette domain-containing protein [Gammaproteobacteria bacterium]|nr:ATP-binding cassette domain-containing protein [Gammaproteobacteria bacterium]
MRQVYGVANLERSRCPFRGEVLLNGEVISRANEVIISPHGRGITMVFQDLALWPNLSVLDNVLLGQSAIELNRRKAGARADQALVMCGIEALANRLPGELSGGQQQRVALARAIATRPAFLFLDELFVGLDLVMKTNLLSEILALAEHRQFTILLVTHDPVEVTALCSSAIVLDRGKVVETGDLEELLHSPQSETLRVFRQHTLP